MISKGFLASIVALATILPASAVIAATARQAAAPAVTAAPPAGHVVGRTTAPLKVVEYVSYTCSHCAAFEREGADPLLQMVVRSGRGSVEYRPLLRNVIDLAATLLVNCGPIGKVRGNHTAVLRQQEKWLVLPAGGTPEGWRTGDFASRTRAVATDLKLYALFEARGYSRAQLNACLANEPLANAIAAENRKAMQELKLEGTPSFLINGVLQKGHDWASLQPALAAAIR